jgi:hypothetical protein
MQRSFRRLALAIALAGAAPGTVHPLPPINIADSGPQGAGDNYLLLRAIAGLGGAGSRMSSLNLTRWSGDYIAAGVLNIGLWANNLGPDDLFLRLLFADPGAGPPTNVAISTDAHFLAAGSGWTHLIFPVDVASLTALTPGGVAAALTGVTELRIFHNPAADFPGPPGGIPTVTTELGLDDIQALGAIPALVPEPATAALVGAGLLALATGRARRRPR